MWLVALALLAAGEKETHEPARDRLTAIECLGEKTLIGASDYLHLMHRDETGWHASQIGSGYRGPWRAPDGRLFTSDGADGGVLVRGFREGDTKPQLWMVPEPGVLRFALLDGNIVATDKARMYRLAPDGGVTDIGPPPYGPRLFRAWEPPVLVGSKAGPIICTSTTLMEANHTMGFCRGPQSPRYEYRVEFDSNFISKDEDRYGNGAEPFACGEVLISARKPGTQARRLADGALMGRARLYARKGSACLPDGRVLIVDRREVGTFASPDLRPLWHRKLPVTVQSATFCGGKIAILPTSTPDLTFIEVPP